MGKFRSDSRGGSRGGSSRGRSERFGGERRGGFRDRDSRSFGRKRLEMHEVTCDKCGKQCEVPFKPTESKPVFCSDCFRKDGDSGSRSNFGSRNRDSESQSGISPQQFNEINVKLDKILGILESLEFEDEEESAEGEESEDDLEEE